MLDAVKHFKDDLRRQGKCSHTICAYIYDLYQAYSGGACPGSGRIVLSIKK